VRSAARRTDPSLPVAQPRRFRRARRSGGYGASAVALSNAARPRQAARARRLSGSSCGRRRPTGIDAASEAASSGRRRPQTSGSLDVGQQPRHDRQHLATLAATLRRGRRGRRQRRGGGSEHAPQGARCERRETGKPKSPQSPPRPAGHANVRRWRAPLVKRPMGSS
jgi:hypothetical protein